MIYGASIIPCSQVAFDPEFPTSISSMNQCTEPVTTTKPAMQWNIYYGKKYSLLQQCIYIWCIANKIASVTNLRSFKWSYSCSIICVGSPSCSPIFWDAKTSAVKGHAPYSPTAATLAAQSSLTSNKITTGNCSLVTRVSWPFPGNAMCYLNLKWSKYLLWPKI